MKHLETTLRQTFGIDAFRPGQPEIIASILAGRDTVAIMPTGGGKSLCYQLPALHLPGVTLVISPLIALMKDQGDKLRELGIKVAVVNSSLSAEDAEAALTAIAEDDVEFIITTPERLAEPSFVDLLRGKLFDLFVIDEAHCVSQWGHDFRPSYLAIGPALARLGRRPVLALTATAPDEIVDDIVKQLQLAAVNVINTGTYRANLRYAVIPTANDDEKLEALSRHLRVAQGAGIVYCATIRQVELVSEWLRGQGTDVRPYHGRLAARRRHETQDAFMRGELRAIVATNAFGMGIDKPDIRFVVHFSMPGSLEAYYQESGRAGRDGADADCVLLYQKNDRHTQRFFMAGRYPTFDDIVATHNALVRLEKAGSASAEQLRDLAPGVPLSKLKVILALLRERRYIRTRREGGLRVVRPMTEPDFAALAADYDARRQRDQRKLEQMVMFAQTARCRWQVILEYFGESDSSACGSCDNCRRQTSQEATAVESVLPLSVGDSVRLSSSESAVVRRIAGDSVEVLCEDGQRREFPRRFLTAIPA